MNPRKLHAALTLSLALAAAAPAAAQQSGAALVGPLEQGPQPNAGSLPDFRAPQGDLRQAGEVQRNGLIAAYRVAPNLQVGIGRFAVPEIARPRTHVENDRSPTGVRPRDRGLAAIGFSLSF